jgi:hypothetical protein
MRAMGRAMGTSDGRLSDCDRSIEVVVAQLQLGGGKETKKRCCTEQWGTVRRSAEKVSRLLVLGSLIGLKGEL